jgi:predicted RNA-binding Zn-ribbon protein involved in translation (DUF1610 family)
MKTVILQTFDNYFYANITLTKLQSEGIQCYLKDEYTVTIDPLLSNAIGGIKLAVFENDVEKASQLLKQYHDEYIKAVECPDCGLCAIELVSVVMVENIFVKIISKIFSNNSLPIEQVYKCKSCGYESKSMPQNIIE